jgi:hypothetical protein
MSSRLFILFVSFPYTLSNLLFIFFSIPKSEREARKAIIPIIKKKHELDL